MGSFSYTLASAEHEGDRRTSGKDGGSNRRARLTAILGVCAGFVVPFAAALATLHGCASGRGTLNEGTSDGALPSDLGEVVFCDAGDPMCPQQGRDGTADVDTMAVIDIDASQARADASGHEGTPDSGLDVELPPGAIVKGECLGGGPCVAPPDDLCRPGTNTLVLYRWQGTCVHEKCVYEVEGEVACEQGCVNGACAADPCQGMSCTTPDPPSCESSTSRRSYRSPGTCSVKDGVGACVYEVARENCEFGCSAGACLPDPCAALACNTPDPPSCAADGHTRLTYPSPGICSAVGGLASCRYIAQGEWCQWGCKNGVCVTDPCADKTCSDPPAPTCVYAPNPTRAYVQTTHPGWCNPANGSCVYDDVDLTLCETGLCSAGHCN